MNHEALRVARERVGVSRREAARRAGRPGMNVSIGEWERGEHSPRLDHFILYAQALGLCPIRLLGEILDHDNKETT